MAYSGLLGPTRDSLIPWIGVTMVENRDSRERASSIKLGDMYEIMFSWEWLPWQTAQRWLAFKGCHRGDIFIVNWIDSWPDSTIYSSVEVTSLASGVRILIPRTQGFHCRDLQRLVGQGRIKLLQRAG